MYKQFIEFSAKKILKKKIMRILVLDSPLIEIAVEATYLKHAKTLDSTKHIVEINEVVDD